MREILFKAKRIDNGEWVTGYLLGYGLYSSKYHIQESYNKCFEIKPETISQFTGLNDKNGNKIFEGDIIKHLGDGGTDIVVFENGRFTSKNGSYSLSETAKYNFEVIGNKFDNPELLTKE